MLGAGLSLLIWGRRARPDAVANKKGDRSRPFSFAIYARQFD
jgi:hypothetical protein